MAGDGNVLLPHGRDGRLAAAGVESLERGFDKGIERLVGSELDDGAIVQEQLDVRFQLDGACEPDAAGHHQTASALLRQGLDGLGKSIGAELPASAIGLEVAQQHFTVGNLRSRHFRHFKGQALGVLLVRVLSCNAQGEQRQRQSQKSLSHIGFSSSYDVML